MFLATVIVVLVLLKLILKLTTGRTKSATCLVGKTAVVTGGNAGIGYQIALGLASRGARVIIADKDDMTDTKLRIIQASQNQNIVTKPMDLSSLTSVRNFAKDLRENEARLDILVHNAGIGGLPPQYTEDKIFAVYQINYLGAFLLTHLLVDLLKKSAPSRIIFASSLMAFTNNLSVENFNKCPESTCDALRQMFIYGNSKLGNIIIADGFAAKLKSAGVASNSLHPGTVYTDIFKKSEAFKVVSCNLTRWFVWYPWSKTTYDGAQTCLHLCLSQSLKNTSGKYFVDCIPVFKPRKAYDKKFCDDIWRMCEDIVGLTECERL